MALRIRRGLESQRTSIVPETGELLYVTDHAATGASPLWIGDGATPGGNSTSGVAPGVANTLARYTGTGATVVPTESVTWNEAINTLTITSGALSISAGNGPRQLINLNSFTNTTRGNSLSLSRARGTETEPQPLLSSDTINSVTFNTYDGVSTNIRASINAVVGTSVSAQGAPLPVTYAGKTGTGPFYITFSIPAQGAAPATYKLYTISGNGNTLYNGSYIATASTTSSITLAYTTDPGAFGSGLTEIILDPIVSSTLQFTTNTSNGNNIRSLKIYQNGTIAVGPDSTDTTGAVVDTAWTGRVLINSTQTATTNIANIAALSVRSYNDAASTQYIAMQKFRGTVSNPTPVQLNDQLFNLTFFGYDGITSVRSSNIRATVDGAVSNGKVPGAIIFQTTNADGTLLPCIRITSTQSSEFSGEIKVGGTISSAITPGTYWNYDNSGSTLTLTLGQTVTFANFSGSVLVNSYTSGTVSQYLCGSGNAPTCLGSSNTQTGTMAASPGSNGYTFTSTEAGVHSFYVIRTRSGA